MACRVHNKQLIMACGQCKTAVCDECIELHHNGHQPFLTLKSAAKTVIEDLQKSTDNPDYTKIEKDFEAIFEICQEEKVHADRTKQELLDRRDHLKEVVDQVTEAAVHKLERHKESVLEELERLKNKTEEKRKTINEYKHNVQRLSTSLNHLEIVVQGWGMNAPEIFPVDFPNIPKFNFSPDMRGDENNVEMLFGELVFQNGTPPYHDGTISPDLGHSKIDMFSTISICSEDLFADGPERQLSSEQTEESTQLKLSEKGERLRCDVNLTFQHSFQISPSAQTMIPTADGKCWVLHYGRQSLALVDTDGEAIEILTNETALVSDVSSVYPDLTFVSLFKKKCIKRVTLKGRKIEGNRSLTMSTFIHTDPFFPYCLCRTQNGDIIVGLTNRTREPVEPEHTSVLVQYNKNGKELTRVQKDRNGRDLFGVPYRVKKSATGSVAVVNLTERRSGHLVMLDNDLNLTHRYVGHGVTLSADEPLPEPTNRFLITDALFNHQNLLLISENYSRTVQLLDPMCNLLKVLVSDLQKPPCSLALHANGDLWVGLYLYGGEIKVYRHSIGYVSEKV